LEIVVDHHSVRSPPSLDVQSGAPAEFVSSPFLACAQVHSGATQSSAIFQERLDPAATSGAADRREEETMVGKTLRGLAVVVSVAAAPRIFSPPGAHADRSGQVAADRAVSEKMTRHATDSFSCAGESDGE
jgi:hypothetical protein